MRYDPFHDLISVEFSDSSLRVAFHGGEAAFAWQDIPYRIGTRIGGEIRIDQERRPVARGFITTSGVRLETVASELLPLIRALAWALTLRSEEIAQYNRYGAAGAG